MNWSSSSLTNKGVLKTNEKKKHSNSWEFENGTIFNGCTCETRNGLQDCCHRSECRGSPECLTNPPTCGPSEFANAKDQTKKCDEFMKIIQEIKQQRLDIANEIIISNTDRKEGVFENNVIREGVACPTCLKRMNKSQLP